jgi:protein-tyrosine phosphatase
MAWPHGRARDGGVDEIPLDGRVAGRLYLCGKHAVGPDPEALLERTAATAIVCLNQSHELADRYPDFVEWLDANAPERAVHHPIADLHAPSVEELATLTEALYERLAAGESLVVNCGAGIGRAGTLATALLMRAGRPRLDALEIVRAHRPMAGPETGPQTDVLIALEERWSGRE